MKFVKQKIKKLNFYLIIIFILGGFLRFYGLNWDQGSHIHPDERFLTMIGNAMRIPNTVADYFNPHTSTFNPTNIGFGFFVYGIFPLTLNKILAVFFSNDSYNSFTLQGRFLSALFDVLIVLLVYKTIELFERKYNLNSSVKYWTSFFYAIAVLPIQLSHFFAVDTFLNFFMFASFYFVLRFSFKGHLWNIVLSSIFFGLAISSKISAIFILPLIIFFLFYRMFKKENEKFVSIAFIKQFLNKETLMGKIPKTTLLLCIYLAVAYITIRLADPYLFEKGSFLEPTISGNFWESVKSLKSFEGKDVWYPPAIQWINKPPIVFSLLNLVFFGVGLPYFVSIVAGFYFIFKKIRKIDLIVIFLWVFGFFLFQSTQFVKAMRYFIFLYPFLAIFAGVGFYYSTYKLKNVFRIGILMIVLLWSIMFISIYSQKHSRVVASEWMYQNLKDKSVILVEYWDDALPVSTLNTYGKTFMIEQLTVFDPDTSDKWQKMNYLLANADYLVLSSNKGWGSIPTVPEKYPLMSKFYQDLFDGRTSYKKTKEFTSYPSLRYLGIPIDFPDDWADEVFTVYDHPKVMIFKKI